MTNITFNGSPLTSEILDRFGLGTSAEEEAMRIHRELVAWLNNPANADDPEYSDVFKDVYGFRPRF